MYVAYESVRDLRRRFLSLRGERRVCESVWAVQRERSGAATSKSVASQRAKRTRRTTTTHTQDTLRTRPSWCPSFRLCEPFGFVGCWCVAERGALAVFRGFRFRASPSQPRKSAHFFNFGALHDATTPQKQNTMSGRGKAASGAKAKAASGAKKAPKSNSRR